MGNEAVRGGGTAEAQADVVVVGFGGAGVCAALQAVEEGASVLVVERFDGGGATRISGGVVYAGGGTAAQREAGIADTPERLLDYLRWETRGLVDEALLRAFCERSRADVEWLARHGVTFPGRAFGGKSVVAPAGYGLFFTGNERQHGGDSAPPRGHIPAGRGQRGRVLFDALAQAAARAGVAVVRRVRAERLLRDDDGRVVGVEGLALPASGPLRTAHDALASAALAARPVVPALRALERRVGRPWRVTARRGVVLAAGGFVFDAARMARHAPAYLGCLPLGTAGDDGAGLALGEAVGAATVGLERCAAWRFIYPPEAFVEGVLVDGRGERLCDESLYGATVGRQIAERAGGRAFLVLDAAIVRRIRAQRAADEQPWQRSWREWLSGEANDLLFRHLSTLLNLHLNRRKAGTLRALERASGMPDGALERTVAAYNAGCAAGTCDACGKAERYRRPLLEPPFLAVVCDLDSRLFLGPCFTLGGLATDGLTGRVLDGDGRPVPGLYAAGRNAAGVCAGGYVTGLSVADCVFSGRNAGRSAARSGS